MSGQETAEAIYKAARDLVTGFGEFEAAAIVVDELNRARRDHFAAQHERGPGWHAEPDKCNCPEAAAWGATGRMPAGHLWYWRAEAHRSGYLAHEGTGSETAPAEPRQGSFYLYMFRDAAGQQYPATGRDEAEAAEQAARLAGAAVTLTLISLSSLPSTSTPSKIVTAVPIQETAATTETT